MEASIVIYAEIKFYVCVLHKIINLNTDYILTVLPCISVELQFDLWEEIKK